MNLEQFSNSLTQTSPPSDISELLKALWFAAKDEWEAAHEIAQSSEGTPTYDQIHAYLHRVEGDTGNAGYWYRRAGVAFFNGSLEEELKSLLVKHLS